VGKDVTSFKPKDKYRLEKKKEMGTGDVLLKNGNLAKTKKPKISLGL
jgi:hypothetical protein